MADTKTKGTQAVFVVSKDGDPLMPTFNWKKVNRLLRRGKAAIFKHNPFTIQLLYATTGYTQEIDYDTDTGYQHAGISVKSEKHEYLSLQADMLDDSKKKHDDRRKNRRTRRNRLRHREPRFNNRKKDKGWLAPSIKDRMDNQVRLFDIIRQVCPVTSAHLEVGKFDTQVLEAVEQGKPVPEGIGYQHGPKYGHDTQREAVFYRDGYTCQVCGKTPFKNEGTILVTHHALYWKGDHTDRMGGLMTLCTDCHTAANHQPGGELWGLTVKSSNKAGAAFMNIVRWRMRDAFAERGIPVTITYGAVTKRERKDRNIGKSHTNDAYCIGRFHPKHRCKQTHIQKRRRNNRCLEKFYDAVYIDSRDGTEKTGKELSCGRTKRCEPRHGGKDLRRYRQSKISKGGRRVRERRYDIQPGDIIKYKNKKYEARGIQGYGKYLTLWTIKIIPFKNLQQKTNRKGETLPIAVGQNLAPVGRKTKYKVLAVNDEKQQATLKWFFNVRVDAITVMQSQFGGWVKIT